jgi:hypothetical protein
MKRGKEKERYTARAPFFSLRGQEREDVVALGSKTSLCVGHVDLLANRLLTGRLSRRRRS